MEIVATLESQENAPIIWNTEKGWPPSLLWKRSLKRLRLKLSIYSQPCGKEVAGMPLLTEKQEQIYDLSQVCAGCLLYGRHKTWREGKAGFVTAVTQRQLTIQYHPGIGNITNYFFIPVGEAAAGEWEIRWTHDLTEVYTHNPEEGIPPEGENSMGENPPSCGDGGTDESGRTDI